jgi:23S rRNA pseudouridine1911/1915/1917 synthase
MSQQYVELEVPAKKQKQRLDKFIVESIADLSRNKLHQLINQEKVLVDGYPKKASHIVQPGERIEITIPPPRKLEVSPEDIPLNIVYEDSSLLVVNKSAGMVVHPAFANYSGTLVNALLHYCQHLSSIGGSERPGLVHRLDKDTSGLIVVAKDDVTHTALSRQFAEHTIERVYRTIVWGRFKKQSGRIEGNILRSPRDRKRMVIHPDGKFAATNYEVIEEFPLMSSLRVRLETGRTHQIRVHLASIGHPVFGDPTYNGRRSQLGGLNHDDTQFAIELLKRFNHQILHAQHLGFEHPVSGEFLKFESPLPQEMESLLQLLRQRCV